jgi:hypothetical protein
LVLKQARNTLLREKTIFVMKDMLKQEFYGGMEINRFKMFYNHKYYKEKYTE